MPAEASEDPPDQHPLRAANRDQPFIYVGGKEWKKLQKRAWDAGWWPEEKRSGILWRHPDGVGQVMIHGSSSDHHALRNVTSEFKKRGLQT